MARYDDDGDEFWKRPKDTEATAGERPGRFKQGECTAG